MTWANVSRALAILTGLRGECWEGAIRNPQTHTHPDCNLDKRTRIQESSWGLINKLHLLRNQFRVQQGSLHQRRSAESLGAGSLTHHYGLCRTPALISHLYTSLLTHDNYTLHKHIPGKLMKCLFKSVLGSLSEKDV